MIKTIFRNTFLVGISVLLLCMLLFFAMQYRQNEDRVYETLHQEAIYAEHGLELSGTAFLQQLGNVVDRISWIDASGEVLFDSVFSGSANNQKDFPEVQEALENGEGTSRRKSESSGMMSIYYAKLCRDGTVIRLCKPVGTVKDALLIVSPVLWVLVLVLLISGVLAFRAARQIVDPINNMDLDHLDEDYYPELAPLINKIEEQRLTIQEETAVREQMRREFTANISHELKTPLTTITGFAQLMAEEIVSTEKVQEFSKDIYKESKRLMDVIDDIIRLSQLDEGSVGPTRAPVDLYALSRDVADKLESEAESSEVMIVVNEPVGEVVVPGVYQLLYEMIYNLCDNAIKYNRPGGSVTLSAVRTQNSIRMAVADTGIGIPEEHQKRVFERFYRVDKSHSREVGGTGLGLSIVKHGAQFHDATVEMESEEGVGTTITIVFPLVEAAEESTAE